MIGHQSPEAMARVLCQYISDDRRVQSEIRAHFLTAPTLSRLRDIRLALERSIRAAETSPCQPHEGYYPDDAASEADRANILFVNALWRELEASKETAALKAFRERRQRGLALVQGEVA